MTVTWVHPLVEAVCPVRHQWRGKIRQWQPLENTKLCLISQFPKALLKSSLCMGQSWAPQLLRDANFASRYQFHFKIPISLRDTRTLGFSTYLHSQNIDGKMTGGTPYQSLSQAFITFGHYHCSSQRWQNYQDCWHNPSVLTNASAGTDAVTGTKDTTATRYLIFHGSVFTDSPLALLYEHMLTCKTAPKRDCDLHHFI